LVIANASADALSVQIPMHALGWKEGSIRRSMLYNHEYSVKQDKITLTLQPWSGEVIT